MNRIPDTQRAAWRDLDNISDKRAAVLRVIRHAYGVALWEIAERLHWPINCVSGRVTELRDLGLIRDGGRSVNPHSGKRVILWFPTDVHFDENGQGSFFNGDFGPPMAGH